MNTSTGMLFIGLYLNLVGYWNICLLRVIKRRLCIRLLDLSFPETRINGCLFHWKQAIRRYMKTKLEISDDQVSMDIEKGVLDLLNIIPRDDIMTK